MRSTGLLLNISSLPNKFGIGGFGDECNRFVDLLSNAQCKWWQILPLTTIGLGNSPYSGVSAFAGNYLYVDPEKLYKNGYINSEQYNEAIYYNQPYSVDYEWTAKSKKKLIEFAYKNCIEKESTELYEFMTYHRDWLLDYALYMTIKDMFDGKAWFEWPDEYKYRNEETLSKLIEDKNYRLYYYVCEQMLFNKQWQECKEYANKRGIGIIGDMPIYVAHDSVDVWANPELFQLDKNLVPKKVAGVPPDYFCEEGQLWGNPIFDYKTMEKDSYYWFQKRFERMFELYDKLRIDHFRAFDRYWAVDYGAENAINGSWEKGPGIKFFDIMKKKFPNADIIAEDLGVIDDGVIKLLEKTGFPGMRVLQFAFDGGNSPHLPHNFNKNSVVYTGTHDNNTTYGWISELSDDARLKLFDYVGEFGELEGGENSKQIWACIRCLLTSSADTVIIPFQDFAGWGGDTRMNKPGVAEGNWQIRITDEVLNKVRVDKLRRYNYLSSRI